MILFNSPSVEDQAQILADHLPNGELFQAKNIPDSVYRSFLRGIGASNKDVSDLLALFSYEIDIPTTTYFLEEWERTLGIPDGCFSGTGTLEERRRDVMVKLASLGVQTESDFENVALLFGYVVNVYSQAEIVAGQDAKFTIVIQYTTDEPNAFTYTFPIFFGDESITILECLFNKLKPANCRIIFEAITQQFSDDFSDAFAN
jgi:uncharacterized protein YmfQ (DUF2313 family)